MRGERGGVNPCRTFSSFTREKKEDKRVLGKGMGRTNTGKEKKRLTQMPGNKFWAFKLPGKRVERMHIMLLNEVM